MQRWSTPAIVTAFAVSLAAWCSWIVPLADRRSLSIRVRNFETNRLKVNDADGNPVEIAAIVVWQVADTAEAVYAVDDYVNFVEVQAESALRHVATTRPYDDPAGEETSLRGSTDALGAELAQEMAERVAIAGVGIVEVRISHLAYASEIAQAMLRRQQANAVVAARSIESSYVKLVFDKPFVFALRDRTTGLVPIAGYVERPHTDG